MQNFEPTVWFKSIVSLWDISGFSFFAICTFGYCCFCNSFRMNDISIHVIISMNRNIIWLFIHTLLYYALVLNARLKHKTWQMLWSRSVKYCKESSVPSFVFVAAGWLFQLHALHTPTLPGHPVSLLHSAGAPAGGGKELQHSSTHPQESLVGLQRSNMASKKDGFQFF